MRRITDRRFGKIPTTSVRRRISSFNRSCGLFERILGPVLVRKRGERKDLIGGIAEHDGLVDVAGLRSPYSAPHRPNASADINVSANAFNMAASRSLSPSGSSTVAKPDSRVNSGFTVTVFSSSSGWTYSLRLTR